MASSTQPRIASFKADGAITKGMGVKLGSDAQHVTPCASTTDKAIGVAQNDTTAAGDVCEVALPGGGGKGLANSTISKGSLLGVNANGKLQKVAAANDRVVGMAMDDAVAGDVFAIEVMAAQATATES